MVVRVMNDPAAPVNPGAFADQAEPDYGHWDIIRKVFEGSHIISGCAVTAQAIPDMTLAVASGSARVDGMATSVTGGNVTITAADATNARFDLVVVDNGGNKSVIAGTANANPCLPAFPAARCILAIVYVPAGDTAINANQIQMCGTSRYMPQFAANQVVGFHDGSSGDILEIFQAPGDAAPPTPGSSRIRIYCRSYGVTLATFLLDPSGVEYGPLGDKAQASIAGRGPSGGMEAPGSTTWSDGVWGTLAPSGLWTPTGSGGLSVADDTAANRGRYMQATSGAVAGDDAGIESATRFWRNKNDAYLIRFRLPDITSVRMFAGIAAQTLATMVGADDPGTNYLGIQFSTPRADTNWQFVERGTGAQVKTDTGVAASTDPFYVQIVTGSFTQIALLNKGFAPVAQRLVGAQQPGSTTLVSIILGVETQAAVARSIQWYHIAHHARFS